MLSTLRIAQRASRAALSGMFARQNSSLVQPDFTVKSPHSLGSYKGGTVMDVLRADTCNWGDRVAYTCPTMDITYTHNDIFKYGRSFGAALLKAGLKRGDIVAVVLPNCPQYSPIMNGMFETGIVASPMSPLSTPDEMGKMLIGAKAKGVVTFPPFVPMMEAIKAKSGSDEILKVIVTTGEAEDGCHSYDDMIKVDPSSTEFLRSAQVDPAKLPAIVLWSSGTTGPPKGVVLTHENLVTTIKQIQHRDCSRYDPGKETGLGLLPMFHVFGNLALLQVTTSLGGTVVTMPSFSPELFISILKGYKLDYIHVVPPLVSFLAANPMITKDELSNLKTIICGGSSCPPTHVLKMLEKCPLKPCYHDCYGMTEVSGASHMLFWNDEYKHLGSVGQPMPDAISKVIDLETGKALPPNTNGEICVKGAQTMQGYLNNPEATKETIDSDGWVHTGDIGYYDQDGFFYVVDRLKELIKVKGLQVAPSELEHLLVSHPKIADAAVIGIPDDRAGELPRAYIVPRDASLTPQEVNEFLAEKVAKHKQLAGGIELVEAVPKSPSGKVLRREIKTKYLEGLKK